MKNKIAARAAKKAAGQDEATAKNTTATSRPLNAKKRAKASAEANDIKTSFAVYMTMKLVRMVARALENGHSADDVIAAAYKVLADATGIKPVLL